MVLYLGTFSDAALADMAQAIRLRINDSTEAVRPEMREAHDTIQAEIDRRAVVYLAEVRPMRPLSAGVGYNVHA